MILPADLDAALYCELVNRPPSEADPLRMHYGPSEQFRLLELELGEVGVAVAVPRRRTRGGSGMTIACVATVFGLSVCENGTPHKGAPATRERPGAGRPDRGQR